MESNARKNQIMIWYIVAAVFGVLIFQELWTSYTKIETIPYSQFEHLLDENKIASVTVSTNSIKGSLKEALPNGKREFYAVRVDPQLEDKLAAHERRSHRCAVRRLLPDNPFVDHPGGHLLYDLDVSHPARGRETGSRRSDDGRQVARQGLR